MVKIVSCKDLKQHSRLLIIWIFNANKGVLRIIEISNNWKPTLSDLFQITINIS